MMSNRCSVLILFLVLPIGCGPKTVALQSRSHNNESVAKFESHDTRPVEARANCGGTRYGKTHKSDREDVQFVIDLAQRSRMRERYCKSTGYECKEAGWIVPEIAKEFGIEERAVDGIPRVMHTYESKEGWFLVSYARKGQPVTAWEIDIKNRDGRYAIFDMDCDGIFEVKALKGYSFVTLPCAKLE